MTKLSIVCSTYNRAAYLDRSLKTYSLQDLDRNLWEYLIVDDGSTDDTALVVQGWAEVGLPVRYLTAEQVGRPKEPGKWRDGSGCRNGASKLADGEFIVMTYPEVLIPRYLLSSLLKNIDNSGALNWVTTIPYWLPPIEESEWDNGALLQDLRLLHKAPGFYSADWPTPLTAPGAVDYRNQNQERRMDWGSDGVLWAMHMETWRWFGGFREFDAWGAIDMDFLDRRNWAGLVTAFPTSNQSPHEKKVLMVYHQDHGDSPRDMEKAFAALRAVPRYTSTDQMRSLGGLNVGSD